MQATVSSQPKLWWPVVAFVAMVAWSNIPPYRGHMLDEPRGLFSWTWKLYQQGGLGVCDVRYFDMNQAGAPIERWKLLGYERMGEMPDDILRVRNKTLGADYDRVCEALRVAGDPQPNVEAYSRCGVEKGWKELDTRKRNICAKKHKKKQAKS